MTDVDRSEWPKVIGISQPLENGDHVVVVMDRKQRTVDCVLPAGDVPMILAALRAPRVGAQETTAFEPALPGKGETLPLNTETVVASQVVLGPDGAKALVLQSLEKGVVAYALPDDETINRLAAALAELAAVPKPGTAH